MFVNIKAQLENPQTRIGTYKYCRLSNCINIVASLKLFLFFQGAVVNLADNNPKFGYNYICCVQTGTRRNSGTTANVAIVLIGLYIYTFVIHVKYYFFSYFASHIQR